MVKIYVKRILAGEMTLEQVPQRWREAVREALEGAEEGEPDEESIEPESAAESEPESAGNTDGTDLPDMTKAELLGYCEEHGIEAYASWSKGEIIAAIEAAA